MLFDSSSCVLFGALSNVKGLFTNRMARLPLLRRLQPTCHIASWRWKKHLHPGEVTPLSTKAAAAPGLISLFHSSGGTEKGRGIVRLVFFSPFATALISKRLRRLYATVAK